MEGHKAIRLGIISNECLDGMSKEHSRRGHNVPQGEHFERFEASPCELVLLRL